MRAQYIRPSSAATWSVCSGNIDMRAMFPQAPEEADSEVCEDGTAAHWLAAEIWEGRSVEEGTLAPNGRVITEEMFDGVEIYHGVIRSWPNVVPVCEKTIPIPSILQGMQGTPDMWAYNPTLKRLYIADFKFGYRFVEVWENLQLICYASGLIDLLGLNYDDLTVEMTIVQPRSFHRGGFVRTWTVAAKALQPFVATLAYAAQRETVYQPNYGCVDCPGRHVCTAFQNSTYTAIELAYADGAYELTPAALGKELELLKWAKKKIEARLSGLEVQAEAMLRRGQTVPGWVLSATYARETWVEGGDRQIMTLAKAYFGVDVSKPPKAMTPNQARKLLPRSIVDIFTHKPSTGVSITRQDPYEARKAFDNGK
jgi:hypothetical protein